MSSHTIGSGRSPLTMPLLTPIVSLDYMQSDEGFMQSIQPMVVTLCMRQSRALRAVVDTSMGLERRSTEISTKLGFSISRPSKPEEDTASQSSGRYCADATDNRDKHEQTPMSPRRYKVWHGKKIWTLPAGGTAGKGGKGSRKGGFKWLERGSDEAARLRRRHRESHRPRPVVDEAGFMSVQRRRRHRGLVAAEF